jgi:hypothetical protein
MNTLKTSLLLVAFWLCAGLASVFAQEMAVYRHPSAGFSVSYPDDWMFSPSENGVQFQVQPDEESDAIINLDSYDINDFGDIWELEDFIEDNFTDLIANAYDSRTVRTQIKGGYDAEGRVLNLEESVFVIFVSVVEDTIFTLQTELPADHAKALVPKVINLFKSITL